MNRKKAALSLLPVFLAMLVLCLIYIRYVRPGSYEGSYHSDEERKVHIIMQGDSILADEEDAVLVEGSRLTILSAGKYILSCSLQDGQIIVAAGPEDEVTLKIRNLNIHCQDGPALWIQSAARVRIHMEAGSENVFSDGDLYASFPEGKKAPNACLYSRSDLTIRGEHATLRILAHYRNGIYTADDMKVKSGNLEVTAVHTAIHCRDHFTLEDAALTLTAGQDGIYDKGSVDLQAGSVSIDADRYGIFAYEGIDRAEDVLLDISHARSDLASHGTIVYAGDKTGQ